MSIASFPPHDLKTVVSSATEKQKMLLEMIYKFWEDLDKLEQNKRDEFVDCQDSKQAQKISEEIDACSDAAAAIAKSIWLLNQEWGLGKC